MLKGAIGFIIFCFIGMTIVDGVIDNEGGMLATNLTSSASASATTLYVASTSGFESASVSSPKRIFINQEQATYTGMSATTFTGVSRGTNGTQAAAHAVDSIVFNEDTQMLNEMSGLNVVQSNTSAGPLEVPWTVIKYFYRAVPNMLTWDYSFLTGPAIYIRYFLMSISGAIMITMVIALASAVVNIFR